MTVKTFTDFINIAGSIGSAAIAFIFPQIFYIKTFKDKIGIKGYALCTFIILFGVIGGSYSIYFSICKLSQGDFS